MLSLAETFQAPTISLKEKVDIFEAEMAKLPQTYLPLSHRFTPGLYIREIFMPAGTVVTSRTHKRTHPFVISKGKVDVMDEKGDIERIEAPHTGITTAGTRRVLVVLEDTIWTAFYVTEKTDVHELEEELTYTDNENLPKDFKQAYTGEKTDVQFPVLR